MAFLRKWSSHSALDEGRPVWKKHTDVPANCTHNASSCTGTLLVQEASSDIVAPKTNESQQTYTIKVSQKQTMRHLRYSECRSEKYRKTAWTPNDEQMLENEKQATTAEKVDRELARRDMISKHVAEPFPVSNRPRQLMYNSNCQTIKHDESGIIPWASVGDNTMVEEKATDIHTDDPNCRCAHSCSFEYCECPDDTWSPYDSDLDNDHHVSRRQFHDNRRLSEACFSERSYNSTDSSYKESGYDIMGGQSDPAITEQSQISGTNDRSQSELDQFYTAPSTPEDNTGKVPLMQLFNSQYHKEQEHAIEGTSIQVAKRVEDTVSTQGGLKDSKRNERDNHSGDDHIQVNQFQNDTVHKGTTSMSALDTFTEYFKTFLNSVDADGKGNGNHKTNKADKANNASADIPPLRLKTPACIPIECLEYETDPHSGEFRTVGKGSFGQVYRARFAEPSYHYLPIVVKEFDQEFTTQREILEEAQRLNYLGDTGFVPACYGLVCLGDPEKPTYGLVQEFVGTGITLEQILWDNWQLSRDHWLSVAAQSCEGLARFHDKGILLNDIKSNNIILEFNDRSIVIKYIDFGLATDMRGRRYKHTKSLEEFYYLAPEIRFDGQVTNVASDIFSLGYMLNQMHLFARVADLKFVAGLCMDMNPDARIPVRAACSLIQDYLGTDAQYSSCSVSTSV